MPSAYGRIGWRDSQEEGPTNALGDRRRGRLRGPSPALVSRLTYLIIALYALTFAVLSVLDQDSFNTNAFDLGNMDQAVWNTAQGRWFQFTNWEGGTSRLAAHVEPILIPISLLYRLYSSPATLLVLQSVVISLGALPAFWLAREKLRNDFAAVSFASAYLLAPALEVANLHDFHPVALASSLLLFAFYFVHRRWYVPFLIAALLAMGTKEQVPLSVAMLGIYIFLVQRRRFWGGLTVFLAVAWLAGAFLVIIPRFSATGTYAYLSRYDYLGASPGEILSNLVLHPGDVIPRLAEPAKANYLLGLFGPLAFLPLLSPATLLMALPDLAINLLSNFPEMYGLSAHYGAVIVPFLIVSAVYGAELLVRGIGRVSKTGGHLFLYLLCFAVLGLSLKSYYSLVFLPLSDHLPQVTEHDRLASRFIALIPGQAGVSAGSTLNPHVSQRERLYLFPRIEDAEYIFLDVTASPYPIDAANMSYRESQLLQGGQWGVEAAEDGYLLLRRGATSKDLPAEFYTFARGKAGEIAQKVAVDFGGALRLVGFNLHPGPELHSSDPYATLTLFWEVQRPLTEDYAVGIYVVGQQGRISVQPFHPTTLWYPTSRWKPGELIKVQVARVPLETAKWGEVLVGVMKGQNPDAAAARLRPTLGEGEKTLSLAAGGTLLKLGELRAE